MRKAIFFLVINLMMIFGGVFIASAADNDFNDVKGHWAAGEINTAVEHRLMYGVGNGKFMPESDVSRAELAAVIVRVFSLQATEKEQLQEIAKHQDLASRKEWYVRPAAICQVHRIFAVNDQFNPHERVTRLEIARAIDRAFMAGGVDLILTEILPSYKDLPTDQADMIVHVARMYNAGIMQGHDGYFRPYDPLKRAELARVLNVTYRILQSHGKAPCLRGNGDNSKTAAVP